MDVIIVGCGRVGSELAFRLEQKGHTVTVVDQVDSAFDSLPSDFRGRTVRGEILSQDVLHRAGIQTADAVATVTNSDTANAVVAHIARTVYCIRRVVARNYNPNLRMLHEAFGLQVISSASWGAQRIEELFYDEPVNAVFSAGNGEVEVYEFLVPESWSGRILRDLLPTEECVAVALTRAGRASLPACESRLKAGDVVHLSATGKGIDALRTRLDTGPSPSSESEQRTDDGDPGMDLPQEA